MYNAVYIGTDFIKGEDSPYTGPIGDLLSEELAFYPAIINKENIAGAKERLEKVELAFATWGMPSFTEEEIAEYLPALKILFFGAGTVQYFAVPFFKRGVRIVSAWAANAVPVAEFTAAQILLANKGYFQTASIVKAESSVEAIRYQRTFRGNLDTKVGLIGMGMIGKKVVKFLKPYRLAIFAYDPYLPEGEAEKLGIRMASLEKIFENCQTISNHLPDKSSTKGMLNYSLFARMRHNATFINTGRGAQIVNEDLVRALRECPDRTALIDVVEIEPIEKDHIFMSLDNIMITPHMAGSFTHEIKRVGEYIYEEYRNYRNGLPLHYEVTEKMLETMS